MNVVYSSRIRGLLGSIAYPRSKEPVKNIWCSEFSKCLLCFFNAFYNLWRIFELKDIFFVTLHRASVPVETVTLIFLTSDICNAFHFKFKLKYCELTWAKNQHLTCKNKYNIVLFLFFLAQELVQRSSYQFGDKTDEHRTWQRKPSFRFVLEIKKTAPFLFFFPTSVRGSKTFYCSV